MSTSEEVRLARAYLSRVAEAPAPAVADLVARVGPVEAARRIRLGPEGGLPPGVLSAVAARHGEDRAASDLDAVAALGGRLVVPEDDEWPAALLAAFAVVPGDPALRPPLALWVRGGLRLDTLTLRSVAVVGSRAASDYGHWVARDWGAGLARRGVPVVSGAALGVDAAAHRGALAADGVTVAVLACGLDRAYPPRHVRLLQHIAARGAVLSEYPPGHRPWRRRFLVRNRLIAALAGGTVLVEAAVRSGALSTAASARRLGRSVMAVPGPVTSPLSLGCHRLVLDGDAELVSSVEDVVEAVGRLGHDLAPRPGGPPRRTDGLDPRALALFDALSPHAALSEDRLAHDSGVDPADTATLLSDLEGRGLAEGEGRRWSRRPG